MFSQVKLGRASMHFHQKKKKKKINKASKWDIQGYYAGPAPKYEHLYNH